MYGVLGDHQWNMFHVTFHDNQ